MVSMININALKILEQIMNKLRLKIDKNLRTTSLSSKISSFYKKVYSAL